MTDRSTKAFTLLEVVLAISIVLGLVTGAFSFYRHVAKVRDSVVADAQLSRTVRLVMDRMTAELQSLLVTDRSLQARATWTDEEIMFTTATLPGPAAWAVPDALDEPPPPTHDVHLITYSLVWDENDEGDLVNLGLGRECLTVLSLAVPDPDEEDLAADVLAEQIMFVRFRYYADSRRAGGGQLFAQQGGQIVDDGWVEQWQSTEPPLAVEITLGTVEKDEEMDIEDYLETYETFRRVVYLPGS